MKIAESMPAVKAPGEEMRKGSNQPALTWIAVAGAALP
jgi:hypothetical protein